MAHRERVEQVTRELVDRGKLIEAGWISLRLATIPADAPPVQLDEMQKAFFAGAQHTFSSIFALLDPGAEPTDADMKRLDQISAELRGFARELELRLNTQGRA